MPPRKKQKAAEASEAENGHASPNTPAPRDSTSKPDTDYDLVADPWTDEQETALLKAIIKWKPVGIHKHFRMIAISEFMKSQGYAPSHAEHTRIPGIWKKLSTLYNLPALDEREDSLITDIADDSDPPNERYCSFQLPDDEYGDMMFDRRLATDGSESPVTTRAESRRGSLVVDADEARSPAQSRGRKSNRRGRPPTRGTRSKRLRGESKKETATGDDEDGDSDEAGNDNGEAGEEASDAAEDDSDIEEEGGDEEGDGEEEEGEGEEEEGEDDDEAGDSPATRSTRAHTTRSKQKDKGAATATRRTGRRR